MAALQERIVMIIDLNKLSKTVVEIDHDHINFKGVEVTGRIDIEVLIDHNDQIRWDDVIALADYLKEFEIKDGDLLISEDPQSVRIKTLEEKVKVMENTVEIHAGQIKDSNKRVDLKTITKEGVDESLKSFKAAYDRLEKRINYLEGIDNSTSGGSIVSKIVEALREVAEEIEDEV